MLIRPANDDDEPALWRMLEPVIRAGETYTLPRDMAQDDALAYWCGRHRNTFIAIENGEPLGTYYIRPNQLGGGDHVANCGYITARSVQGRGVARMMCEHSLTYARGQGYRAMQFNFVVSTNARAIALWQSLGFEIAGRLPLAFRHPTLGFVDAFVMVRVL